MKGRIVGALLLAHVCAPHASAQQPSFDARVTNLAANAAIGAVVATVHGVVRGQVTLRTLARGATGGMLMSAGKQIAGTGFDGAGLVGRQVNALAVPLIVDTPGDTLRYLFPAGPVTLELRPKARDRWRARVDLTEAVTVLVIAATPQARFDWGATLSTGSPIVLVPPHRIPQIASHDAAGVTFQGTVLLADNLGPLHRPFLAHEVVHVLQWDAYRHLLTLPLERAVVRRIPGLRRLGRHVDLGVVAPASLWLIAPSISYENRPWEREAYALTEGCPGCGVR